MPAAARPRSRAEPVGVASSRQRDVRAAPLRPMFDLLREAGIEALPLLRRNGFKPSDFDDPEGRVDFFRAARLIDDAARATGHGDFGLRIGQRFEFADFGLLAALMGAAPTVGDAIASLQRWFHLHDRGAVPVLRDAGDGLVGLGYGLLQHDTPGADQVLDIAIVIAWRLLRALCGPGWKAVQVNLAHGVTPRPAAYRRCFGAPLQFDAAHSEVQFERRWLAAPVAGADAARMAAMREVATQADAGQVRSVGERARSAAQLLALQGQLGEGALAAALGLSRRTLRRRLGDEGTSVRATVGRVRFEWACQLLQQTRLPVADIAAALHYADATAFARAFKAWAGMPPSRWRARQPLGTRAAPG
jgi:AraC-like DNA-binding protein